MQSIATRREQCKIGRLQQNRKKNLANQQENKYFGSYCTNSVRMIGGSVSHGIIIEHACNYNRTELKPLTNRRDVSRDQRYEILRKRDTQSQQIEYDFTL